MRSPVHSANFPESDVDSAVDFGVLGPSIKDRFVTEVSYIAKTVKVKTRHVNIVDHPCGESVIFVKINGSDVYYGYLDQAFYSAMEKGKSFIEEDDE